MINKYNNLYSLINHYFCLKFTTFLFESYDDQKLAMTSCVIKTFECNNNYIRHFGSGVLNPGAVFLRFVTVAFLLFLAPAGCPSPAESIF